MSGEISFGPLACALMAMELGSRSINVNLVNGCFLGRLIIDDGRTSHSDIKAELGDRGRGQLATDIRKRGDPNTTRPKGQGLEMGFPFHRTLVGVKGSGDTQFTEDIAQGVANLVMEGGLGEVATTEKVISKRIKLLDVAKRTGASERDGGVRKGQPQLAQQQRLEVSVGVLAVLGICGRVNKSMQNS